MRRTREAASNPSPPLVESPGFVRRGCEHWAGSSVINKGLRALGQVSLGIRKSAQEPSQSQLLILQKSPHFWEITEKGQELTYWPENLNQDRERIIKNT